MSSPDRVHRIATGDSRSPEVIISTAMKMMPAMIIAAARKKVTERKLLPSCELLPSKNDPDGVCAVTETTTLRIIRNTGRAVLSELRYMPLQSAVDLTRW